MRQAHSRNWVREGALHVYPGRFSDRKWEPTWVLEPGMPGDHTLTHPFVSGVSPTR